MSSRLPTSEAAYVPHRVLTLVDNDIEVASALLRRFVDDIPGAWHAVVDAIAEGKPTAIAQSVHYLKGSLALVEAGLLTDRMTDWERDAKRGLAAVSTADLVAARDALVTLLAGIRDFLDRAPVADVVGRGRA